MFLSSVSGGLIALGLIATATRLGTAFYASGLVLLPLLAFVGLVTFERTLQSESRITVTRAGSRARAPTTSNRRPSCFRTC